MRVTRLRLHAFRNYHDCVLHLDDGPVIIRGPNGAGKTGVLEAVHLLATGRSFRTSDQDVLLATGSERGIVEAEVGLPGDRLVRVGAALGDVPGGRRWMLNGVARPRHKDIAVLRCVVFAPDDLRLAKGGPADRRDYLDEALVSVTPRMAGVVSDYMRVLKQRNVLLRSIRGMRSTSAPAALDTWTEMLASKGADLVVDRVALLDRLEPRVREAVEVLAGEAATAVYAPTWTAPEGESDLGDRESVRHGLEQALAGRRGDELERGLTLVGPHRDDMALTLAGRDARTHASQGEQRIMTLALRLAHLAVLEDSTDDPPVLLLDDVFSELDPDRRGRLLERLPVRSQTLITTTSSPDSGGTPPEIAAALEVSGLTRGAPPQVVTIVEGKVVGS